MKQKWSKKKEINAATPKENLKRALSASLYLKIDSQKK